MFPAADDLIGETFRCRRYEYTQNVQIKRGRLSSNLGPIIQSWRFYKAHSIMLFVMVVSDLWHVLVTGPKLSRSGSGASFL